MTVLGLDISYPLAGANGEQALEQLSVAFERAGEELADWERHVFPRLGPVFEEALKEQFAARGKGPHAGTWAPLSARYAEWKARNFPGKGVLERSGRLMEALTQSNSPFAKRVASGDTFDFGTAGVPYASFHQVGTQHMVDRPPFDFGSDFERELSAAALDGVREALQVANAPPLEGA